MGNLVAQTKPIAAGEGAKLVIDPRNSFIMYNIMKDITRRGTAARASALGRRDIAGKTGTTNDMKDAWFAGFNPDLVAVVYVGFDRPRSLGPVGYGGRAALPIWMDYMRYALKGKPEAKMAMPKGLVARGGAYFYEEFQSTNPQLALDNRSAKDISDEEKDTNNPDLGGTTFTPSFQPPTDTTGGSDQPSGGSDSGGNNSGNKPPTDGTPARSKTEQAVDNVKDNLFN